MRYFTQIECRNRRGMKKRGRKVSGFAFKRTGLGVNGKETNGTDGSCGRGAGDPGYSPVFSPGGSCAGEPTPQRGGHVPGGHVPEQLLVTTNDSRLRLYNTDDFGMNAKFKGFTNDTLQLTATFSEDGKQIICGSENGKVCRLEPPLRAIRFRAPWGNPLYANGDMHFQHMLSTSLHMRSCLTRLARRVEPYT